MDLAKINVNPPNLALILKLVNLYPFFKFNNLH